MAAPDLAMSDAARRAFAVAGESQPMWFVGSLEREPRRDVLRAVPAGVSPEQAPSSPIPFAASGGDPTAALRATRKGVSNGDA